MVAIPHLLIDAIVLAVLGLYDWRKRARVHLAYVVGGSRSRVEAPDRRHRRLARRLRDAAHTHVLERG
jgi:hypothetical protein